MKNLNPKWSVSFFLASAVVLSACEKGGPRTPEGAVLKAKCERGFKMNEENAKTVAALQNNLNVEPSLAIRTYITKMNVEKSAVLNLDAVQIISTQEADQAFQASTAKDAISVTTDCANLKASVKGPGFEIKDLDIKNVKKNSIELEKTALAASEQASAPAAMNSIKVKIEKSGRLAKTDSELKTLIDDPAQRKSKHKLKEALKKIEERQMAAGNLVIKLAINVKGAANESISIEQYAGEITNDDKIDMDISVLKNLAAKAEASGEIPPALIRAGAAKLKKSEKPEEKESKDFFLKALEAAQSTEQKDPSSGPFSIDPITGGRADAKPATLDIEQPDADKLTETELLREILEKTSRVAVAETLN